ncbi:MAG: TonB family protein, partial [Saprospiraceae bacterium]
YLAANIKYPASAYKDKIEGKVFVSFVVEKDGTLGRSYIEKGIDGACNDEALRVIRKMNTDGVRWSPGKNEGHEVPVVFTLPISFKLENNTNSVNKPQGSVKVKAGDQFLRPDQYEIDSQTGRVRVIDQAILSSGIPITIDYEDNSLFGFNTNFSNDLSIRNTSNIMNNPNAIGEQKIYAEVDELPRFPGCESEPDAEKRSSCASQKMFEYISSHLRYPLQAKDSGIQGNVLISFVVNPDGSVSKAKVLKDIGGGCATSALDMVREMNTMNIKWVPGKSGGKSVATEYVLPLSFNLIGGAEIESAGNNLSKTTNNLEKENKLKIIPNPASHQVEINWNKGGDLKIEIIDISGRVVIQSTWTNFNGKQIIDLSRILKGTYIVRVQHGESMEEQKLLLQ